MGNGYVGVAPGTSTLRLADGTTVALADWVDDQYYSTGQFGDGDTTGIELFVSGRSQQIAGGQRLTTFVDTNVPKGGELPKDYEMLIYGWGIEYVRAMRPATTQTQPQLQDTNGALSNPVQYNTLFQLNRVIFVKYTYNNKVYTSGTTINYPQGFGIWTFATTSAFEVTNNGVPSPRDRKALVLPVHERENLSFNMSFDPMVALQITQAASDGDTDAPLHFVDIKAYKYGLIKRTVV